MRHGRDAAGEDIGHELAGLARVQLERHAGPLKHRPEKWDAVFEKSRCLIEEQPHRAGCYV
jgi:hypothetical protein